MAVFIGLALAALVLDMVTHRDDKPITLARASIWSVFWVAISVAFAGFLYVQHGAEVASLFLTGYALEKALSVDNLFVFMAIFAWFKVPDGMRHRILHWGIIGAIVFRGVFVVIGTGLLAFGPWVEIAFALIVAWTAVMMLKGGDDDDEGLLAASCLPLREKALPRMAQAARPQIFREPQAARGGSTDGRAGHEPGGQRQPVRYAAVPLWS